MIHQLQYKKVISDVETTCLKIKDLRELILGID